MIDHTKNTKTKRRTPFWKLAISVGSMLLASACSVSDYKKPVTDFATATRDAEQALTTLDRQVTEAYAARLREDVFRGNGDTRRKMVLVRSGECGLASERCRLVARDIGGSSQLLPPAPLLGNLVALMESITIYTQGLTEIVNADTADQVTAHVNATLGSIENLATDVDRVAGSSIAGNVTAYQTSVGKGLNWLFGQYVAKVQLDGLREATYRAQPVISRAAQIFQETATLAAVIANEELVQRFESAFEKFNTTGSENNLEELVARAAAYDRVLMAKPSSVYQKLGSAHEALTKNLQNEDLSLVEVMAKIEAFATEAKALDEIVREIAAADDN